ncbi:hypothetical protein [Sorangium sp. So ce117]|uniref:hypothetical protein n=1 Tax=Sorangium sp. So ce117 TaxID=3133277 RepID=UPI003F615448
MRVSLASFSRDVPDFVAQLGGNDDFHVCVRPSAAVYVLYYPSAERNGLAVGGAVRYLRLRYTNDAFPGMRDETSEVSPEAIAGYKWHPSKYGFYLLPWLGASMTAWRSSDAVVGERTYDPLPVQLFLTVNLGWELAL